MQRFSSLTYAPAETRRLLRERFARYLPSHHAIFSGAQKKHMLHDELLLHLFLNLRIDFGYALDKARTTYEAACSPNANEPSFESLITTGWIRVAWGRIFTPFEIARAASSAPAGTMTAFATLLAKRHEQTYSPTEEARNSKDLATVVAAIDGEGLAPRDIGCQSPEWVAARLWDPPLTDSSDLSAMLREWVDRWEQLGAPSLVPGLAWNERAANAFRETVIEVLGSDPSLVGWDQLRARFVKQLSLASQQPSSSIDGYVPPVPPTLVERALWLEDHRLQRPVTWVLEACGSMFGLIRLLLADVEQEDYASAPHKIAGKLIALALEHPELLLLLLLRVRRISTLLADLLLYPATSALACLLAAQWQSPSSAWDRELTARDNQTAKTIAFADAASIMGYFLRLGSVRPDEAAALLTWLHSSANRGFIDDVRNSETMLTTLRGELASQSVETLRNMVAALTINTPHSGLGTSAFAAALDIIDVGTLAGEIDPAPIVEAYINAVAAGAYTLSAHRVGAGGAASLFELATRSPPALRQKFLCPVDIKARLANGTTANENPFTLADNIARSVRAHVRILSRAVVGWKDTVPDDLVDALIAAVRAGAMTHKEKGRMAAFSPRYEQDVFGGPFDRPIAADLGSALDALAGNSRERLLAAILETDEPMVLAQLLSVAPHATRFRIEERITDLTPSEAGEIHSLTEVQARIEELLSAGALKAAEQFIEVERNLKMGDVPGRTMARLRATLRLQLLRGEWDAIASTEPPPALSSAEQSSANDTVVFYRALAELKKPKGDLSASEQVFAELFSRRPDVAAYAINLSATRISLLLGGDLFALLHGSDIARARQVLRESEQMMRHATALSPSDSEIFGCNKALLLLASGQPDQVIEVLIPLRAVRLRDTIAAYSAVALYRMGRVTEAAATLDTAEQAFGGTDVLRAARAHIGSGTPFGGVATVSSENDPSQRIKAALHDLLQLEPPQQARMLYPEPEQEPFDSLVISYVRSAAASVVSLVPMMKSVIIDSCEDDLTAFIRELLWARLDFLKWSVADQSKGGFTAKENPGERDLLLQKNNTTLAVIEAVVCNRPVTQEWMRGEFRHHFQKLFAYSTCRLFFHLTYAYIKNLASLLEHLRQVAEKEVPPGFTYVRYDDMPLTNSQPTGFVARYEGELGEVKVVFLVLNMGQHHQKQAAKTADRNNPRKRKPRKGKQASD